MMNCQIIQRERAQATPALMTSHEMRSVLLTSDAQRLPFLTPNLKVKLCRLNEAKKVACLNGFRSKPQGVYWMKVCEAQQKRDISPPDHGPNSYDLLVFQLIFALVLDKLWKGLFRQWKPSPWVSVPLILAIIYLGKSYFKISM